MLCKTYLLSEEFPELGDSKATLTAYVQQPCEASPTREMNHPPRPSILIFPGGGYEFVSDREAEPIALRFVGLGFPAFVLRYSVAPSRYPQALLEASAATVLLRRRAQEWNLDTNGIAVCGFSAGGHLAASLGTLWNEPVLRETLGFAPRENRPDAMVLCYAVITAGPNTHAGTFRSLLGENPDPALLEKLSLEKSVGPDTPPAFLWHTAEDTGVPCENCLLMALALKKAGVPLELHLYHKGSHGLALAGEATLSNDRPELRAAQILPHVAGWPELCAEWMRETLKK